MLQNKKQLISKIIIFILYLCTFLLCFFFLYDKIKYAVNILDDIYIFLTDTTFWYHARYIYILFNRFIIETLPNLLHINIAAFSVISQAITKIILFYIMVYVIVNGFFSQNKEISIKNGMKTAIVKNLSILFVYFITLALLLKNNFLDHGFHTLTWFNSYVFPLTFIVLAFYKITDLYMNNKNATKAFYIGAFFLPFLIGMGNEVIFYIFIVYLLLLLSEILISVFKNKIKPKTNFYKIILYLLVLSLITAVIIINNAKAIYWHYKLEAYFPSLEQLIMLFKIFIKKIILGNIFSWIILIYSFILLKSEKEKKLVKSCLYYISSMVSFYIVLIFLPWTCYYIEQTDMQTWLLNPPFLAMFDILMFSLVVYLIFNIIYNEKVKIANKIIILSLLIVSNLNCAYNFYKQYRYSVTMFPFISQYMKTTLYKFDKASLYNIKHGISVLDYRNEDNGVPYYIFAKFCDDRRDSYFIYLKNVYKINIDENVKTNMVNIPYDEYIKKYEDTAGKLTNEELEKLDFSKLTEIYEEDKNQ